MVVGPGKLGRGYAHALYRRLIERAVAVSHVRTVCEINSDPPYRATDAFHVFMGFKEVGNGVLAGGH